MLTSSILNSVTFKDLDGGLPNRWNTLHENRKHGAFKIIPYCQQFNKDDVVYLQFTSDSDSDVTLTAYNPDAQTPDVQSVASSYEGDDNRYFFNFEVTLGAAYYDKKIWFVVTQDTDELRSEPIYCRDLTADLTKRLKKIQYYNLDRNVTDLSDYWVDWSVIDEMYFYVESVNVDPLDPDDVEILEGSQSKTIIASSLYAGEEFKTGGIPDYMEMKLKAASLLDVFLVNGIQYLRESANSERFGQSTSWVLSLNLTEKNTIGLNVDDLGIVLTEEGSEMPIVTKRNVAVTTAGWQVENPEGYMLHSIWIKHAGTSVPSSAQVKVGTTVGGDELLDVVQGTIAKTDPWKTFSKHYLKDADAAYNVYVSVIGTGAVMDIIMNFDTIETE